MKKNIKYKRALVIFIPLFICVINTLAQSKIKVTQNINSKNKIEFLDLTSIYSLSLDNQVNIDKQWDYMHSIATLQGIINRDTAQLFIKIQSYDDYWMRISRKSGGWLENVTVDTLSNVVDAITFFKDQINGVVVYDPNVPSTSNVASSIAGIDNLMAIRYDLSANSLYNQVVLNGPKLPVKCKLINDDGTTMFKGVGLIPGTQITSSGSIKNDPYLWFIDNYMKYGKCNTEFGAYYLDQYWRKNPTPAGNQHTLSNHDFFVSRKAFFFDLSPWGDEPATDDASQSSGTDLNTLKKFLQYAYNHNNGNKMCYIGGFPSWAYKYTKHAGGKHDDVPTEWEYGKIISAYNAFMDADALSLGTLANSSFWQHFPLKDVYQQNWVTKADLIQRGYLTTEGKINYNGRKFILFYAGDFDASSWVAGTATKLWDDPNRGRVPIMWSISPVLQERIPMALDYFRSTATTNDYFAAADNGAGYLNPGMLQYPRPISGLPDGLKAWADHCKKYYQKWDLTITGFIIDGNTPGLNEAGFDCYASFSPNGIVPQKAPLIALHSNMPILRAGPDINDTYPDVAATKVLNHINSNTSMPFYWFRAILKSPTWYWKLSTQLKNSNIELLDAPTFFELLRYYINPNYTAVPLIYENEKNIFHYDIKTNRLHIYQAKGGNLSISNLQGMIVYQEIVQSDTIDIQISNFPHGIYIATLVNNLKIRHSEKMIF